MNALLLETILLFVGSTVLLNECYLSLVFVCLCMDVLLHQLKCEKTLLSLPFPQRCQQPGFIPNSRDLRRPSLGIFLLPARKKTVNNCFSLSHFPANWDFLGSVGFFRDFLAWVAGNNGFSVFLVVALASRPATAAKLMHQSHGSGNSSSSSSSSSFCFCWLYSYAGGGGSSMVQWQP